MEGKQETIKALIDFKESAKKLSKIWDQYELLHNINMEENYPFDDDFQEIRDNIVVWVCNTIKKLEKMND